MIGKVVAVVTLLGMVAGGIIWAEDRYLHKDEAVSPQTVMQLQQVLNEQIKGLERKNLMQDFEFLTTQEKRARVDYQADPSELNRMELMTIRQKRERVKEDLGL